MSKKKRIKTITKTKVIKGRSSQDKVQTVMEEFKAGTLKSSNGKVVTNKDQALAIALSEAGMSYKSLEKIELLNKVRVMKSQLLRKIHKEDEKQNQFMSKVIKFFSNNADIEDIQVHDMADGLGIPVDEMESTIYNILSSLLAVGKSKEGDVPVVDEGFLKEGIEIEMEHTSNVDIARKIAMDHLVESYPLNYYTYLKAMEKAMEEDKNAKGI